MIFWRNLVLSVTLILRYKTLDLSPWRRKNENCYENLTELLARVSSLYRDHHPLYVNAAARVGAAEREGAALRKISFRLLYTGLTPKTRAADLWTSILNGSWNCLIFHVRQRVHGAERISEGLYPPSAHYQRGQYNVGFAPVEIQKFLWGRRSQWRNWSIRGENGKLNRRTCKILSFFRGKWCDLTTLIYSIVIHKVLWPFITVTFIYLIFFLASHVKSGTLFSEIVQVVTFVVHFCLSSIIICCRCEFDAFSIVARPIITNKSNFGRIEGISHVGFSTDEKWISMPQ